MFLKKLFHRKKKNRAQKKRSKYRVTVDSENLAFPEIHIKPAAGAGSHSDDIDDKAADDSITYDNVAIPEVHIRKRRNKKLGK